MTTKNQRSYRSYRSYWAFTGGHDHIPSSRSVPPHVLVEATTNVVVGFLLALLTQIAIFPLFGLVVSAADNLMIGGILTAVSILRSLRVASAVRDHPNKPTRLRSAPYILN